MTRRLTPLRRWEINGWLIEQQPNTFATQSAYEATATDAEGFRTAKHGFDTLTTAKSFCQTNIAPTERVR